MFEFVSYVSSYKALFPSVGVVCGGTRLSCIPFSDSGIRKEGNVLFNDTLNTFYLRLYGIRHMVKIHR